MAKRKYTKKSNYWKKFDAKVSQASQVQESVEPATMGPAYHVSEGSYARSGSVSNLPSNNTSVRNLVKLELVFYHMKFLVMELT